MHLRIAGRKTDAQLSLPPDDFLHVIGRSTADFTPDIDLAPDVSVSRQHAHLKLQNGDYWIEDVGSRLGTFLNGVDIRGTGLHPFRAGDCLQIGKSKLTLSPEQLASETGAASTATDSPVEEHQVRFSADLSKKSQSNWPPHLVLPLLETLQSITRAIGDQSPPAEVARVLMPHLGRLIPNADHAAMLLVEDEATEMVLAAHQPEGDPRISVTLAKLAIDQKQAFVWSRQRHASGQTLAQSIDEQKLDNVLCAPMIWQDRALGVLWLSGPGANAFSPSDLNVAVAIGQQTAMAFAGYRAREQKQQGDQTLKQILSHFSPRVAYRLLEQARQGRLRPGGVKSQVTLLCSDLRAFTRTAATMSTDDVVDMLNAYFAELVAVLLKHEGTIDKFIGDAILAVFGSPEPDPMQYENAVAAAREMQQAMRRLNELRAARRLPVLDLGIGVHCGQVLHGFIGSEDRVEFTVIGDAVNRTSRYCDAAGPGEILISPQVHQLVWRKVKAKPVEIQTKHEGNLPAFVLLDA
jgi:adenylate cyclase